MKLDLVTLTRALELCGASADEARYDSKVYHALGAIVGRQPERFGLAIDKGGIGRVLVSLTAVKTWYARYRPQKKNAQPASLLIYLNAPGQKGHLEAKANALGRPSISAAVQDWADGDLVMIDESVTR